MIPSWAAICLSCIPPAASSTIRARSTSRAGKASARDPLQRSLFLLIQHHWSRNTHSIVPLNCKDDAR